MKTNISLVDTHCHIHDSEFVKKIDETAQKLMKNAIADGVEKLICVGTDLRSSHEAVEFVHGRPNCFASVGIHPHEAAKLTKAELNKQLEGLEKLLRSSPKGKIVAIGECGLDYFYHQETEVKNEQKQLFRRQLSLAENYDLPLIFHIRDAFEDFFTIIDIFKHIRGVVHSFSAGTEELDGILKHGLFVGLNGIMTFTKVANQLAAAKAVPLEKMVLETDAPFLTPAPFRGKMCEPKHVRVTAEFLSQLRGESLERLAATTTDNAHNLFGFTKGDKRV